MESSSFLIPYSPKSRLSRNIVSAYDFVIYVSIKEIYGSGSSSVQSRFSSYPFTGLAAMRKWWNRAVSRSVFGSSIWSGASEAVVEGFSASSTGEVSDGIGEVLSRTAAANSKVVCRCLVEASTVNL